jgi:hypothetical protein
MPFPDDDLFPPDYIPGPRFTPYENLEGAKLFWLILKTDEHRTALAQDVKQLPGLNPEQREIIEAAAKGHRDAINEATHEMGVLTGNDAAAKRALVKKNVQAWIANLKSRASDFRRYADKEHQEAADANNKQDRERHEGNEQADREEANRCERMAGELDHDLKAAGL